MLFLLMLCAIVIVYEKTLQNFNSAGRSRQALELYWSGEEAEKLEQKKQSGCTRE